jgi:hypothetical protein
MADCLFCKIANHEIQASIVYEDDAVVAFNDINPQAPTHILVVPRQHIASLNDLTPAHDQIVGEVVRRAAAIAAERRIGGRLSRRVQHQPRRRADRLPHPPAPDWRPQPRVAARIERSDAYVAAPVLVMSAEDDVEAQAGHLGAVGAVRKPFDPDELLHAVSTAIRTPGSPCTGVRRPRA